MARISSFMMRIAFLVAASAEYVAGIVIMFRACFVRRASGGQEPLTVDRAARPSSNLDLVFERFATGC